MVLWKVREEPSDGIQNTRGRFSHHGRLKEGENDHKNSRLEHGW